MDQNMDHSRGGFWGWVSGTPYKTKGMVPNSAIYSDFDMSVQVQVLKL